MSIRYVVNSKEFFDVSGAPIAYWISKKLKEAFSNTTLYNYSDSPSQNITGNNERFIRKHWELDSHIINKKDLWIFYCKGGEYRKWWGNLSDVVNWTPTARYIYQHGDGIHASQIINKNFWYKKGITWGIRASSTPNFRVMPENATYDKGGSTIIVKEDLFLYCMGFLNSNTYYPIAKMFNPTTNFQVKDVRSAPLIVENKETVDKLVDDNVSACKQDWDSFETSWDFKKHPLI